MRINIETIPHNAQRYETCGDWWFDPDGTLQIRVSDLGDPDQEFLIAIHEAIEVMLCQKRGINQQDVDDFDMQFEKDRIDGLHSEDDEPGDDPKAPYRREHFFATSIERLVAAELGIDWDRYADAVVALSKQP